MRLSNHSAVPVYTISGSSTTRALPDWLARKRKRSLKNDPEFANRIEILQDFEFEEASQCIRVSEDGEWVMSTGTYKPQIHTHYLPHLSLSFSRHTISLNTTFVLLSTDYTKSLHLQSDRSLEFHTPVGCHYTTRIPRYGRALRYNGVSTEALVPAAGINENGLGEVFRLNLEVGKFMRPFEIDVGEDTAVEDKSRPLQGNVNVGSVTAAAVAENTHGLLAFGTSIGTVEFWDPRARSRVGILPSPTGTDFVHGKQEITCSEFDGSGLGLATGSSAGLIHLYDLRSPLPLLKKDQGYGYPIQDIVYLSSSFSRYAQTTGPKILSSDKRIIKLWSAEDGAPWTSIEPTVDINSVAWCKDSGMLLTANEGRQQHAFFIPQLGPAPKWCAFLDNLVEEMAEDSNDPQAYKGQATGEIYDNYKFLTEQQLERLNLSHLIGTTSLLRPYMHGYFVAQRLYEEAKLIADPFIWEEQRDKKVKEKIEAERESRIRGTKKATAKVNKRLAEKLMDKQDRAEERRKRKALQKEDGQAPGEAKEATQDASEGETDKPGQSLLTDPRFSRLFEDEAFAIDETSREFQLLNPSTIPHMEDQSNGKPRGLTAVEQEELDEVPPSDSDDDDMSDRDKSHAAAAVAAARDSARNPRFKSAKTPRKEQPRMQMQVTSSKGREERKDIAFGLRAKETKVAKLPLANVGGEKEITFAPARKGKPTVAHRQEKPQRRDRRSASGNVMRKL